MTNHELVDDGGDGTGGDDGGDSDVDDPIDLGNPLFSEIAPSWLTGEGVQETLKQFAKNPRAYILGSILVTLLNGVEATFERVLDLILFLYQGETAGSTAGAWGIADIPVAIANSLGGVGFDVGTTLLTTMEGLLETFFDATASLGPLGPPVAAAVAVAVFVALLWIGETVLKVIIDAIPGGGGLL